MNVDITIAMCVFMEKLEKKCGSMKCLLKYAVFNTNLHKTK